MKNSKLRGLVLDYETSPQKGWFWGNAWETGIIKIEQHTQILSGSYMDVDGNKVYFISQPDFDGYEPGVLNDRELCKFLSELINQYDYVVAQNGDEFDIKVLNTRLAYWELPQVSTEKSFDTKKMAQNNLRLPSNRLNDIAEFFGFGEKLHTDKELWFDCMAGDPKAWKLMKEYNMQDVVLCERIFRRLLPYVKQFNQFMRMNNVDINCSNVNCLSNNLREHKKRRAVNGWKMQYQCMDCGRYTTDNKIIKEK